MIKFTSVLALTAGVASAAIPPARNAFPEGERLVYGRLIEAYRKNNAVETSKQRESLARNYPNSVYLDNAYYLTGVLAYQNNRFAEAVQAFGTVVEKYPRSNKRASAMFAKGMTYDKLGLRAQALKLWNHVVDEYPGHPDAARARVQLAVKKR